MAAVLSFFVPGLGQLIQGRLLSAMAFFLCAVVGYLLIIPGLGFHLWSIVDAAKFARVQAIHDMQRAVLR